MKKGVLGFVLSCLLPLSAGISCEDEKAYIPTADISFQKNHVRVWWNREWIFVPEVHADREGFFIKPVWNRYARWICPYCTYNNPPEQSTCYKCGRSRATDWNCARCGSRNSHLSLRCSRCGTEKSDA